ncbi:hypothetical protein N4G70_34175 [Streptomyces sp. ASQP_92]|jgi:hypothetical protein|uniref:hypothetical protein n=1 Tax=Streptomyces sp. ASQP_92 TaxID=2979116 RepID=UPI0021BEB719|nr:hypothetical protein [Streptomyces sp. ASQP_92]MCT9093866.1 hypothetical protein [Streptomyces sp. ASQP_92]
MTDTPVKTIKELREASEASEAQAKKDKTALLDAAVKEAMTSTAYGHLSAVAREAGIAAQYLRTLIEEKQPGWLDQAAEEREAAKAAKANKPKATRRTAKGGEGGTARRTRKSGAAAA